MSLSPWWKFKPLVSTCKMYDKAEKVYLLDACASYLTNRLYAKAMYWKIARLLSTYEKTYSYVLWTNTSFWMKYTTLETHSSQINVKKRQPHFDSISISLGLYFLISSSCLNFKSLLYRIRKQTWFPSSCKHLLL